MIDKKIKYALEDFPVCLVVFLGDGDATVISANNFFYSLLGYTPSEFEKEKKSSFKSVIYKEDLARFVKFLDCDEGETGYFDFNIINKNGSIGNVKLSANVIYDNGEKIFKCVVTNMKVLDNSYEDIFQWECYRYIFSISDDIIFRYNISDDCIEFGKKYFEVFGRNPIIAEFAKTLKENPSINSEDVKKVLISFNEAKNDLKRKEVEIRIRNRDGKFEWFSLIYKIVTDADIQYCIGRLYNINKQKNEKKQLIEKSQIDGLTKLYNRPATEKIVEDILDANYGSDNYALMIIDVDDFKGINDTYGHLLGDAVLMDVSRIFRTTFRDTDIIGRIGGDEFLVFMNKFNCEGDVKNKAAEMCRKIRALYEHEVALNKVSVSVGIAVAKKERILYKDLFKNADLALYETKQKGKNGFTIFDKSFDYSDTLNGGSSSKGIVGYVKKKMSEIFERESNNNKAVNEVISLLGNKFNPSTVYVYIVESEHQFAYADFQWCNKGIEKINEGMKEIPLETGVSDFNYLSYFNRDNIFYCTDVDKLEYPFNEYMRFLGSKSILECLIYNDNSNIVGYIGFSDYSSQRLWVQSEVDALSAAADILGTHFF